jgi:hypothetical protein
MKGGGDGGGSGGVGSQMSWAAGQAAAVLLAWRGAARCCVVLRGGARWCAVVRGGARCWEAAGARTMRRISASPIRPASSASNNEKAKSSSVSRSLRVSPDAHTPTHTKGQLARTHDASTHRVYALESTRDCRGVAEAAAWLRPRRVAPWRRWRRRTLALLLHVYAKLPQIDLAVGVHVELPHLPRVTRGELGTSERLRRRSRVGCSHGPSLPQSIGSRGRADGTSWPRVCPARKDGRAEGDAQARRTISLTSSGLGLG